MSKKVVLSLLVLGVFLLHQDFWNWRNGGLVLGFLPVGLAYHAAYAILSAAMMWVLVKFAWPKQLDAMESDSEQSSKEERE
jgi:surface polysaccharide O-acyltransferase-like enzyme